MRLTRPRKSRVSRADRPGKRLPLLSVSPHAVRLAERTFLFVVAASGAVGGSWWYRLNIATIPIPVRTLPASNSYAALVDAANQVVNDEDIDAALKQSTWAMAGNGGDSRAEAFVPLELPYSESDDADSETYLQAYKEALVRANRVALQRLRVALPRYAEAPPVRDRNARLPELTKLRRMAQLLALEGQVAAMHRDYKRAAASSLDAMELAERIGHGGGLIHKFVSIACESVGRKSLMEVADKLSASDTRSALARLETLMARRSSMADALTEDKWLIQAELDTRFKKENLWQIVGDYAPEQYGTEGAELPSFWNKVQIAWPLLHHRKSEIADAHRRYMDQVISLAKLPFDRDQPGPTIPPDYLNRVLSPSFSQAGFKETQARRKRPAAYAACPSRLPGRASCLT